MRDKKELPSREPNRRGPRAVQDQDERIPRRKSKVADPQDDRDRDSPLTRHRSVAIRAHERERGRDSISYYQGRSSHASKYMSSEEAQKAIRTLFKQVKEVMSFFANFREEYQREVRGIEVYAGHTILEKLWERKIEGNDSKDLPSKGQSKSDVVGVHSGFDDASYRLWDSLKDAYEGARTHPSEQNNGIARKLDIAIKDFRKLLEEVRTRSQGIDGLIKELTVLKVVLELGGAGTASHDDRANPRPRTHAAGRGRPRDSCPEGEDARYEGMGEDSGSEDKGQHDEQYGEDSERSGGREESEVGRDGEGQGAFPTDQSV